MEVNHFSQHDLAAFINSKKADDSFIKLMNEFIQSRQSVENDTHLVSVNNAEVQTAQGEGINISKTIKVEKVNHPAIVENMQQKHFPDSVEQGPQSSKGQLSKLGVDNNSITKIGGIQAQSDKLKEVLNLNKRRYYSLSEVASYFSIGTSTMHKYRKNGDVMGFLLGGKWQFTIEQIEDFEKRLTSGKITKEQSFNQVANS